MGDGDSYVTVVSGLPRSGTSMMMRMLDEGGVPALTDAQRVADTDNPGGYYEFERVKALPADRDWVPAARGQAVKVIYKLVYDLPADVDYRIVFMVREIDEVMASQNKMLAGSGITVSEADTAQFAALFRSDLAAFRDWVSRQPNIRILYVDYRRALHETGQVAAEIAQFLGRHLDTRAMAQVVDPALYRNRA